MGFFAEMKVRGESVLEEMNEEEADEDEEQSGFSAEANGFEDDVAFLDDVLLAFETDLGSLFGSGDAAGGEEVVPANDFRANEALFDVAVNGAGGFDGGRAFVDGPGADFGLASGEELHEAHEIIRGTNQAVKAGFLQTIRSE